MGDLAAGMRYLGRGQRWVFGHGRWFGFGLLPALVALVLYVAALTALAFFSDDIAAWATPFADGWGEPWRDSLRILFAVLLWLAALLLSVLTFTAVTLVIGDPFYEKLSEQVEEQEGGAPRGPELPMWREAWISLCDSLYVLRRMLFFTVPLFFLGFLPVVGQTLVPALGFCVSGFFLTLELVSVAMQRRGISVRERLRMLRTRRALALGFGVPLVLAFLVPLVAVLLMPGAVAGAALLVRDLTGEDEGRDADDGEGDDGEDRDGEGRDGHRHDGHGGEGQADPGRYGGGRGAVGPPAAEASSAHAPGPGAPKSPSPAPDPVRDPRLGPWTRGGPR
ncbi:EI24 domain-containing protein [Streptomyces sp. HNM0575]|uniref:EI24 domain-containing protein n=1 Tax=Streptomyces sp. HNM0575 TaxID=2716338 RepID=UPI00145D42E5|nr:EI24 domain-containing protein [Streptomyces sp. HNM0575]NLU74737.1 EI24 domain-containing protein [Streptomyces sp. HNM0575]